MSYNKRSNIMWALSFIIIIIICLFFIFRSNSDAVHVEVYVDGELTKVIYDINGDESEYKISNKYGENTIVYGNGAVWMKTADCSNQVCVNFGKIKSLGQSIICAPHKLVVKLVGEDDSIDAVQ